MKLVSWNVAGRSRKLPLQAERLRTRAPDVVALQEVTLQSAPRWREALAGDGLAHVVDTVDLLERRKYCNLIASRWPLETLPALHIPFPERVLSVAVEAPFGQLEIHNAHLPPGVSVGLKKVETFEKIYERVAVEVASHRILCGDFNTPQAESASGEVTTWADRRPKYFDRWDKAERSVLLGLAEFDLPDLFRQLNGYDAADVSWVIRRKGRETGRRFDHVFASASLGATACAYLHEWRVEGLSDHSAIEAVFEPSV